MVGVIFLVVALLLGRLFRPVSPTQEKSQAYECGEPPVGSSFVQFDLRFYVVALLFIVFEVELAFFFPPAVVFGKLTQILSQTTGQSTPAAKTSQASAENEPSLAVVEKYQELGIHRLTPAPIAELESSDPDLGRRGNDRHGRVFCRADGWFCLLVEARRPGLGAGRKRKGDRVFALIFDRVLRACFLLQIDNCKMQIAT